MSHDVVVIGGGLSGMVAALRAAEAGARVLVLAKGAGATQLAPSTIDVLGFAPDRVESPAAALPGFVERHPGHPYGRLGIDSIRSALGWFTERFPGHRGDLERNHLLPTALGVAKPTVLAPETMVGGDLRSSDPVCVVGLRPLRDFHAALMADNLTRTTGVPARGVELDPGTQGGRPDENAVGIARRFDDPAYRRRFADGLAGRLRDGERVALPAVLGVADAPGVWRDLERWLGRPVFEVPTVPPSAPGFRLFWGLRDRLRRARGRLIVGSEVGRVERAADGRAIAVHARTAGHDTRYPLGWLVLATGGFMGGGLELDSRWHARERLLDLPLVGMPGPDEARFAPVYFDDQPAAGAGIAVDEGLRPLDAEGARAAENVVVVGANLAGATPWREGSGDGLSLTSGWVAGGVVTGEREAVAA